MDPARKPLQFKALTRGLGFHPFSDGLPYAPLTSNPQIAKRTETAERERPPVIDPLFTAPPIPPPLPGDMGTGAVAGGKPVFVTTSKAVTVPAKMPPLPKGLSVQRVYVPTSGAGPAVWVPKPDQPIEHNNSGNPALRKSPAPQDSTTTPPNLPPTVTPGSGPSLAPNHVPNLAPTRTARAVQTQPQKSTGTRRVYEPVKKEIKIVEKYLLRRSLAYALDFTIYATVAIAAVSGAVVAQGASTRWLLTAKIFPTFAAFVLAFVWILVTGQEIAFGTSVGKKYFGLEVRGQTFQIFFRSVAFMIGSLLLGVGLIWAFFDPHRRCWHDIASGTQPEPHAL